MLQNKVTLENVLEHVKLTSETLEKHSKVCEIGNTIRTRTFNIQMCRSGDSLNS